MLNIYSKLYKEYLGDKMDLPSPEYHNQIFPELYKDYEDYYKKETIRIRKEKEMGKFNEKKIKNYVSTVPGKVCVTLSDGMQLEGSVANVTETLKALGVNVTAWFDNDTWYYSDSKGWVEIAE